MSKERDPDCEVHEWLMPDGHCSCAEYNRLRDKRLTKKTKQSKTVKQKQEKRT